MTPLRLHRHARPARQRPRQGLAQPVLRGLVDQALLDMAILVSARGICAREAAQMADLPLWDLDRVEAACQCKGCRAKRLH